MILIAVPAEFTICERIMFLLLICVLACLKNEAVDRVLPAALIFIFLIIATLGFWNATAGGLLARWILFDCYSNTGRDFLSILT